MIDEPSSPSALQHGQEFVIRTDGHAVPRLPDLTMCGQAEAASLCSFEASGQQGTSAKCAVSGLLRLRVLLAD
jgi:hypothetical protein